MQKLKYFVEHSLSTKFAYHKNKVIDGNSPNSIRDAANIHAGIEWVSSHTIK